jgi:hypothetical protein
VKVLRAKSEAEARVVTEAELDRLRARVGPMCRGAKVDTYTAFVQVVSFQS